jgi:hypothetical protein
MALSSTVWPEGPIPQPVKDWLSSFFETADTPGQASAEKFASFFTEDGTIHNTAGVLNGREGTVFSSVYHPRDASDSVINWEQQSSTPAPKHGTTSINGPIRSCVSTPPRKTPVTSC